MSEHSIHAVHLYEYSGKPLVVQIIEYSRGALTCTLPLCVAGVYLIYFSIGNLSYTPCSEPSRSVLLLDVIYTTDFHHQSTSNSPPWANPFNLFLHGVNTV